VPQITLYGNLGADPGRAGLAAAEVFGAVADDAAIRDGERTVPTWCRRGQRPGRRRWSDHPLVRPGGGGGGRTAPLAGSRRRRGG